MPGITISEAAKQGYASRPTIYRHLKNGKVTATRAKDGRTLLDAKELRRVYGEPSPWPNGRAANTNAKKYEDEIVRLNSDVVKLQAEVKLLSETVKHKNETIKNRTEELEGEHRRIDKLLDIIDRAQFDK